MPWEPTSTALSRSYAPEIVKVFFVGWVEERVVVQGCTHPRKLNPTYRVPKFKVNYEYLHRLSSVGMRS